MQGEERFVAHPSGSGMLPEYREAIQKCCIHSDLLSSTPLRKTLDMLGSMQISKQPKQVMREVVKKAFQVSDDLVDSFYGRSHVMDSNDREVCGIFVQELMKFYGSMSWEKNYLCAALDHLAQVESPTSLSNICGLMTRGNRECAARKRAVFSSIISHCSDLNNKDSENSANSARDRVLAAATTFVEDFKVRAMNSTFVEPIQAYCAKFSDNTTLFDLDVHGVSNLLAVLQASTGVVLNRLPCWDDVLLGCADFVGSRIPLDDLWDPVNLGKSWTQCRGAKEAVMSCRTCSRVPTHGFIWPGGQATMHFAEGVVDPSGENAENRERYAKYLHQFFRYFSEDVFLPRLVTALTSGLVEGTDGDSLTRDLHDLAVELELLEEEDDVRMFLWGMQNEDAEVQFDVRFARTIFDSCGVTGDCGTEQGLPAEKDFRVNDVVDPSLIKLTGSSQGFSNEVLTNLLSDGTDPHNKWLHLGATQSWIRATFVTPQRIGRIGLRSANDCPERDPAKFTIRAKLAGGGVICLVKVDKSPFNGRRWKWVWYEISVPSQVEWVSLDIHGVVRAGNSLQLGQIRFERPSDEESKELFVPTSLISLSSSNQGHGDEQVYNLLSESTNPHDKWLVYGASSAWVRAKFDVPQPLFRVGMRSANDCPHRDPSSFRISAKAVDGGVVSIINVKVSKPFPGRWSWLWFDVPKPGLYEWVHIAIHNVVMPGDHLQLGELKFQVTAPIVPSMVPSKLVNLTAASSGFGNEELSNLLSDSTDPHCKWLHLHASQSWITATFESPLWVTQIGLRSANDCPHRDPAVFEIEGRTSDGQNDTLVEVSSCPFTERWQWVWYDIQPSQALESITIRISDVVRRGDSLQLGQIQFKYVPSAGSRRKSSLRKSCTIS